MPRLVPLALLMFVACASAESDPAANAGAAEWLESWREARQCLVADAEDLRTGIAKSILVGRDCAKQVYRLGARKLGDELQTKEAEALVAALVAPPATLSQRAKSIEKLDDLARRNGQLTWPVATEPLPTLRRVHPLFGGKDVSIIQFNGGAIEARLGRDRFSTEAIGNERAVAAARDALLALPSRTWSVGTRERPLGAADSGERRVVVRRAGRSYAIDSSLDGGKHWTTRRATASVVSHWQDARTGVIELLVLDTRDSLRRHRIDPRTDVVQEQPADSSTSLDAPEVECTNGGFHWGLDGDRIARFGEAPLKLGGSARHGELDCRGDAALVLRRAPDVIERCHQHCWEVFAAPAPRRGYAALLDDGRWLYAAAVEDIVAVWSEPGDRFQAPTRPRFYRLPKSAPVVALTVLASRPALVVEDNGYQLVPLK